MRQLDMLDGSSTQLEPRTTQAQTGSVAQLQPASVTQSQPSVSAPAGASAQTVHSGQPGAPPGASAAVVTASPPGPVQAKATATDDSQNIRTRKQSKEASDKIHQEHHALVCLNVLNNLYGFENSTLTSPSKLTGWLKKCKKGSKNASD